MPKKLVLQEFVDPDTGDDVAFHEEFLDDPKANAEQAREASFYHTGEVTGPGTLVCAECGKELHFHKAGHIPPCPGCRGTRYRRGKPD